MNATRSSEAGATRTCPHCKATILASAAVCPACRGHLRFDSAAAAAAAAAAVTKFSPLQVEGTIHAPEDGAYEYTMVLSIRNERGEEINRQLVGVGALFPGENRSFSVVVEATEATGKSRRRKH
ncbi:MAG TPA: hypothetical protein VFS99_00945 [Xanthomonadaceae bacterium]|nr:hypothetical protein [Xanthomonadaceae bacterium]